MRHFAKRFMWTAAIAKGQIDGSADSKDAEQADASS
jgi:hypothetical protein